MRNGRSMHEIGHFLLFFLPIYRSFSFVTSRAPRAKYQQHLLFFSNLPAKGLNFTFSLAVFSFLAAESIGCSALQSFNNKSETMPVTRKRLTTQQQQQQTM